MKKRGLACLIIGVLITTVMSGCVKIVKVGEEDSLYASDKFDAVSDVAGIWDSTVLPELKEKAVDLVEMLTKVNGDLSSVGEEYGVQDQGTSSAWNFTVRGTGEVVEINTESRAGYIEIKLDNYSGSEIIKLQIGPVFKGTAVRDCSEVIKFENYTNQVDYAAVSKSIHETITETIINDLDINSLQGKNIKFIGCFTLDKESELIITPIDIEVQ